MRVLLLHPPVDGEEPPIRRTESLGLGYITAVLREQGHRVDLFDAYIRGLRLSDTIDQVLARDFDCLAITAYDIHKRTLISIARRVRRARRDAVILAGGYLPTFTAEKLLPVCPEIDLLVRGEGETVVREVFDRLEHGKDWRDVPGIAYLKDGQAVLNPLPPPVDDLDTLPFPARDELAGCEFELPATILRSRGCYHRCSFCSIPSFYALTGHRAPRFRSPDNVIDEAESVIASTGIREFVFADDNFIGPGEQGRERVRDFVAAVKRRNLDWRFSIECRVDEIDEEILSELKDVGLFRVFLGIESGVQRQLDTYNKRTTVDQNRRAIEMARNLGLIFYPGFIMLDPYTTLDEMIENMRFVRELQLDNKNRPLSSGLMTRLNLYSGTPLIERVRADGLLREKGLDCGYVFRDPALRLLINASLALTYPGRLLKRAKRRLG